MDIAQNIMSERLLYSAETVGAEAGERPCSSPGCRRRLSHRRRLRRRISGEATAPATAAPWLSGESGCQECGHCQRQSLSPSLA